MGDRTRLVADVGGTNTRLAVYDTEHDEFRHVARFTNSEYASLAAVIDSWRGALNEALPTTACLAIAAPPGDDVVTMFNIGWSFSCRDLATQFGFDRLHCINDFQANAYALPHLDATEVQPLYVGGSPANSCLATVGPGTGLGGATLRRLGERTVAVAAEPGHMSLSPASSLELDIFRHLLRGHSNIYAELLVSGAGLARLYQAICELAGDAPQQLTPAEVSARALDGSDKHCLQALQVFCALLGSVCGDFLLANGCYGGLYLAGGIVPQLGSFLQDSDFLHRLQDKGAMAGQLRETPVYVIVTDHPGLKGAAHAPAQLNRGM